MSFNLLLGLGDDKQVLQKKIDKPRNIYLFQVFMTQKFISYQYCSFIDYQILQRILFQCCAWIWISCLNMCKFWNI